MKANGFDPRSLDVAAAAKQGVTCDGETALAAMPRLAESAHEATPPGAGDTVLWQARCESRPVRGAASQVWLHLRAETHLWLVCQRCLQPVAVDVHGRRSFQFVAGEADAARLDADSEDDVLALTRSLDLLALAEDELLLNLPLVPRHEVCPQPLPLAAGPALPDDAPHPFAALAALKRGGQQG